jgi:hypothetical protein
MMVNAGVVNGGLSYFSPATFCESFAIFGRILRFQNPFKYICNSRINPNSSGKVASAVVAWRRITAIHQYVTAPPPAVKFAVRRIA